MSDAEALTSDAFRQFVEDEYDQLVRAVALASGDAVSAEDAVQEALTRAWECTRKGLVIHVLRSWTLTVALNEVRKSARRANVLQRLRHRLVRAAAVEAFDVGDVVDLRAGLDRLPRRQREATVLHYYLGLSMGEIATVLGVSDGTIKSALHRARSSLAAFLHTDEEVGDVDPAR